MRCLIGILLALTLLLVSAMPVAAAPAATKKPRCVNAYVDGIRKCLRPGQRCRAKQRDELLLAGFDCRRRLVRRATERALRGGEPVYIQPNGRPRLATALQAFDMTVADMPGVTRKPGLVGNDVHGTGALRWVYGYRNKLTRAQRAAFDRALTRPRAAQSAAALQALADRIRPLIEAKGLRFNHRVRMAIGGTNNVTTNPQWLPYRGKTVGSDCLVTFSRNYARQALSDSPGIVAHELIHCVEAEFVLDKETWLKMTFWPSEGFGIWAGAVIGFESFGTAKGPGQGWVGWQKEADHNMISRPYQTMGFFGLLAHEGVNPWERFEAISRRGSVGDPFNGEPAFREAILGAGDFARTWGTTLHTNQAAGLRWDLNGQGMKRLGPRENVTIANGTQWGHAVQRHGAWAAALKITAEVVTVTPTPSVDGYIRLPGGTDIGLQGETFCTVPGGCTCDDGTEIPARQIQPGAALLGYAGAFRGGNVSVRGQSVEKRCDATATIDGLEVYGPGEVGEDTEYFRLPLLARFRTVRCSRRGNVMTVTGAAGGDTITLQVRDYSDGEDIYEVEYGGPVRERPVRSIRFEDAGAGIFDSAFGWPGSTRPTFAGTIGFDRDPRPGRNGLLAGAAMVLFNNAKDEGVQVIGVAPCARR